MVLSYEVYWGRVWTNNLRSGNAPQESATVALFALAKDAKPESVWPSAPAGWHVSKVNREHGWVAWRKS
jgi:hypothetical protein